MQNGNGFKEEIYNKRKMVSKLSRSAYAYAQRTRTTLPISIMHCARENIPKLVGKIYSHYMAERGTLL